MAGLSLGLIEAGFWAEFWAGFEAGLVEAEFWAEFEAEFWASRGRAWVLANW